MAGGGDRIGLAVKGLLLFAVGWSIDERSFAPVDGMVYISVSSLAVFFVNVTLNNAIRCRIQIWRHFDS